MKLIFAFCLALQCAAAPPLFRAQNAAVAAGWSPADGGFTAYWWADDIAGANNDPIDVAPDGVGSNNATSSGAARPRLILNAYNGHAAMRFDAIDDKLLWTTPVVVGPQGLIVTVVARSLNSHVVFAVGGDSPTTRPLYNFWSSTSSLFSYNSYGSAVAAGDTSTGPHIFITYFNSSAPLIRKDGVLLSTVDSISPDGTDELKYLGYQRWDGSLSSHRYTAGDILFVGIVDGSYSGTLIADVEAWAIETYGISP